MVSQLELVDARPVRPASRSSLWEGAVALRDHMTQGIHQALDDAGIDALVLVSQPGVYPPWVRLEAWVPTANPRAGRRRCELEIIVAPAAYREDELVVTARAKRDSGTTIEVTNRPSHEFGSQAAREWAAFALGRAEPPSNYTPLADALIGLIVAFIPLVHGPHHNAIDSRFRNQFSLTGAKCLVLVSAVVGFVGFQGAASGSGAGAVGIVLALAGLIGAAVMVKRRVDVVAVPPQPTAAPRTLALVDSWHTGLSGLGDQGVALREEMERALGANQAADIHCALETHSYRTPNGYEHRERLVVTKGQSIVQVHIHPFGDDLFVAWHAYLNRAQWGESTALSHRVADGVAVTFRDLQPVHYAPNQFDLIDLSSLSELVHRHLERAIKRLMSERAIDQEIDFTIIRGDRARSLDRGREAGPASGGLLQRVVQRAARWQRPSDTEVTHSVVVAEQRDGTLRRRRFSHTLVWAVAALVLQFVSTGLTQALGYEQIHYGPGYSFYFLPPTTAIVVGFLLWYAGTGWGPALMGTLLLAALSIAQQFGIHFILWTVFSTNANTRAFQLPVNAAFLVTALGCTLLVMAIFLPPLRAPSAWLVALIVWVGGQLIVQSYLPEIIDALGSRELLPYAYTAPRLLAFGYLGHRLQRALAAGRA